MKYDQIEQLEREFPSTPKPQDAIKIAAINEAAKAFAKVIIDNVPWTAERHQAGQAIREAVIWAKEAIQTDHPTSEMETRAECNTVEERWCAPQKDDDYWMPAK